MPTIKQRKAAQKVVENHGNISRAMLEAGYTPASAKNPKNLTESRGWNELMEEYLSDEKLFKAHEDALEANKVISAHSAKEATAETDDFIEVPDHAIRLKAAELGYKVKGKLRDGGSINIQGEKVLVVPAELMEKYGITPSSEGSSER